MTMTNDPDLDQAIEEMVQDARRLRLLQRQVAQADEVREYRNLASRKFELAELTESFNVRGEKLCLAEDRALAGRALLMVTEEADRLRERDRQRRRPSFNRLRDAMSVAAAREERMRLEAASEVALAEYVRKIATHNAAATASVLRYMDASRA